jgi:hypothetical protein
LKDKSLVRDPTKIAGLRKSNPKKEKILFDLIKDLLSKWIANEGPNGGIKGVIKNNFQPVFAGDLDKKSDEYKEYCTLFFIIEAILKLFEFTVDRNQQGLSDEIYKVTMKTFKDEMEKAKLQMGEIRYAFQFDEYKKQHKIEPVLTVSKGVQIKGQKLYDVHHWFRRFLN